MTECLAIECIWDQVSSDKCPCDQVPTNQLPSGHPLPSNTKSKNSLMSCTHSHPVLWKLKRKFGLQKIYKFFNLFKPNFLFNSKPRVIITIIFLYFIRLDLERHSIPAGMEWPFHSSWNAMIPLQQDWNDHSIPAEMEWCILFQSSNSGQWVFSSWANLHDLSINYSIWACSNPL